MIVTLSLPPSSRVSGQGASPLSRAGPPNLPRWPSAIRPIGSGCSLRRRGSALALPEAVAGERGVELTRVSLLRKRGTTGRRRARFTHTCGVWDDQRWASRRPLVILRSYWGFRGLTEGCASCCSARASPACRSCVRQTRSPANVILDLVHGDNPCKEMDFAVGYPPASGGPPGLPPD